MCVTAEMCVFVTRYFVTRVFSAQPVRGRLEDEEGWRLHGAAQATLFFSFFLLQSTLIKVIDCVGAVERLRKSHHVHVSAKNVSISSFV